MSTSTSVHSNAFNFSSYPPVSAYLSPLLIDSIIQGGEGAQ